MRYRCLFACTTFALALAWARSAQALDTMAILGIEAEDGVSADLAGAVTTALRQEAAGASEWRHVPGRDLVEVKLIFSCPDEAPSCMSQVAESLNATHLLFGTLKAGAGGATVVALRLLDARAGKIRAHVSEPLPANQRTAATLRAPARRWFATLTGKTLTGSLRIESDTIGASVAIDGVPSGITTGEPLLLPNLEAGPHTVAVSKRGHASREERVRIEAGVTTTLAATLQIEQAPQRAAAPAPRPRRAESHATSGNETTDSTTGLQFAAWSTAGVSVLSFAVALKFGLDVLSTNQALDKYRGRRDLVDLEIADKDRILRDGQQAEQLQYVFLGIGGALAVGSAALFYFAYSGEGSADSAQSRAPLPSVPRVFVSPTVSTSGAGFFGRLTF